MQFCDCFVQSGGAAIVVQDVVGVRQSDATWFLQLSAGRNFVGTLFGNWTNFTGINQIGSGDIVG